MTSKRGEPVAPPEESTQTGPQNDSAAPNAEPDNTPTGLEVVEPPPPTREQWDALQRERDEIAAQLLRKRAEFENYRRRVERDRLKSEEDVAVGIFRALIPTLDNLERALGASGADDSSIREGVALIHRELAALLESHGVVSHDPTGQPFDPLKHQALAHEAVPGFVDGTVVEVFQKGYFLKDRLLRPALVKVAKGEEPRDEVDSNAVH